MVLKTPNAYEFGPFHLEPGEHRLTCDGEAVALAPKAFELLVYLVENHGRLLLKDEIMQAVWTGSFVEDANLTVSISAVRKLLGKTGAGSQYIETVPKKGYRFIAPVTTLQRSCPPEYSDVPGILEPSSLEAPPLPRKRPMLSIGLPALLGCVLALSLYLLLQRHRAPPPARPEPEQRSLAILPLRNLKQDPDSDFLGFSLADAVITKLGSVGSLVVRPSSAVEKYRGQMIDVARVAGDLHADLLLAGSFLRDGDSLRITYQLIDAKADRILGKDTLDLRYDRLLTVQDDVAQWIIHGLELHLSPSEMERIKSGEPLNPLAYEYYLRGVDLLGKHDFPLAIRMFEKSAAIDGKHALTWAYLGYAYTSAASFVLGGRDQYRQAKAAEERALLLDPKQPEASEFLANLLVDTGSVEEAVPLLRSAIAENARHAALHWELGYAYRFAGMLEESVAECERARNIDPLVRGNGAFLNSYLYLGEYDTFLATLPDASESPFALFYRGFGEYHKNNRQHAARDFAEANRLSETLYTRIGMAFVDSMTNRKAQGSELLGTLESEIHRRGVGDPEASYKIAEAFAALGDSSSALRALRDSIQSGFFAYPYMKRDPLLASLRQDPRLPAVLQMALRRHLAFRRRFF